MENDNKLENKKRKIGFIINPASGTKSKLDYGDRIVEFFKDRDYEIQIEFTKKSGDATQIAKQFSEQLFDTVAVIGGDGTINEAVNGMGKGVSMAIIPNGSGNGLARHLCIPLKFNEALELINTGIKQSIDVMDINGRISANVSGVGFDALVAHKFQNLQKRGLVSYIRIVVNEFATFRAQNYELIVDGKPMNREAYLISFANSSQFGNNALISPSASVMDGEFDLCVIKPFPKISSPVIVKKLLTGTLDKGKYLEVIRAKTLSLRQESDIYHLDGDAVKGHKELEIKLIPSYLSVITPQHKLNKI